MISSREIRLTFLEFFQDKQHTIVPSAPIVVKNDPTLMFTNAGMNQFKDYFLGNKKAPYKRAADTQKCLRVSGKHNDLEEVGVDHYHHTMFEMLGNWSFGDYFKKEAIAWSWELLTDIYKIDKDKLYVTVFEGDEKEGLPFDQEAYDCWAKLIDPSRILKGNKKDNFWEMGDTGPCGPCSEIHVDMRGDAERKAINGDTLVNKDHPEVIEIWNNVFMEFNRKADGSLEKLPAQHVDTGMGFERLTRVLQEKTSNYDTDIFQPLIQELEKISGKSYSGADSKQDIAFRVIADHIRAVAFCIADGQLPSNNAAGYVIRRILRRALRYGYSYLGMKEPFIYKLIPVLCHQFDQVFNELMHQRDFVARVIQEEEKSFLKTLEDGIQMFNDASVAINIAAKAVINFFKKNKINFELKDQIGTMIPVKFFDLGNDKVFTIGTRFNSKEDEEYIQNPFVYVKDNHSDLRPYYIPTTIFFNKAIRDRKENKEQLEHIPELKKFFEDLTSHDYIVDADFAFKLYDTKGFPIDLTKLLADEKGWTIDFSGFETLLHEQKERSRKDAVKQTGDWQYLTDDEDEEFIGYDFTEANVKIARYRTVKAKDKEQYQLVFNITPFYAESGGQVGDTGIMKGLSNGEIVEVIDTQKENNLIIHYVNKLPADKSQDFEVMVDDNKRHLTNNNHSATHLMHAALKEVLGSHVAQKGSLVNAEHLRFDFSHFAKVTDEELNRVEEIVNLKISEQIPLDEKRLVPIREAIEELGATALFGEKYGDLVRVITFDKNFSVELCGGTHVQNTALIRRFKITSESSVAAGVRRIEAITHNKADEYFRNLELRLKNIWNLLGEPKDIELAVQKLTAEKNDLHKRLETLESEKAVEAKKLLEVKLQSHDGVNYLFERLDNISPEHLKTICFQLRNEKAPILGIISSLVHNKPMVTVFASDDLVKDKGINCGNIVRDLAKTIDGGGGGQPFYATAGGKKPEGLNGTLEKARQLFQGTISL